ncbi:MAG: Peptidylprolyl isomerase [Candidatus Saccharibacteria bacterium]|nr:Peptidylprolyl isomerase [Candidatus Saccharibacteria bacterium]
MKKLKKLKKPKVPEVPRVLKAALRRGKSTEEKVTEALANVPRITNETVTEHREEVLSSARKYIYPLQHSKHRIVRISIGLFIGVLIVFFAYCGIALYKLQSNSTFLYGVTKVIPFPVAKTGNRWVSYESYLFELRRNLHYYQTQQATNFADKKNKSQLQGLKQLALQQVVDDAYVKQLAAQSHVSVTDREVDNEVALVRSQNRLGSSDRVFKDVLNEFWGWSVDDFKRELKQQLLAQKVVAKLDTATVARADSALAQLNGGADFATLAAQVSDSPTKANGGQFPAPIGESDRNVAPQITSQLFRLKPGEFSGVINTGFTLEIVKVGSVNGNKVTASDIQFVFKDIKTYSGPLAKKQPVHRYIKV